MRLIDADVAKKAVHEEFDECLVWDESGRHTANAIEEILEALPTVDAIPVELLESHIEYLRKMADHEFETNGGYFGEFHYRMYEAMSILKMWEERKRYDQTD